MIIFQKEFGYGEIYRGSIKDKRYRIRAHIHQFCEIVYVMEGVVSATIDGKDYELKKGEIAVITPFQMHTLSSEDGTKFWMCVFSNNCVPNYHVDVEFFHNRESSVFCVGETMRRQIEDMLIEIEHPIYVSNDSVPRKIKALFYSIFSEFTARIPTLSGAKKSDVLSSIFLYLNGHYREKITLKSISKALGYNAKYLSQCLGALPNTSFPTILNSLRVDHAKSLLLSSNFKIIDIAYECGFESEQSFHRAFLSIAGMTPGQYRKASKKT
jgi:AraC-like DNA-binding protein